jgi:SAM-dependent methyltransferase
MCAYAHPVNRFNLEYWEELAQRDPYFPVLTIDGHLATEGAGQSPEEFFATGEADVSALLAALSSLFKREIRLGSVLDFGCGAGRLTLPLARRAKRVVACDISPTMLAHARRNAEAAGLSNIEFVQLGDQLELSATPFDFVCSLAVFQYIPAAQGYGLIRSLARALGPGGIAAIQLRFSPVKQRDAVPLSTYNERRVVQCLEAAGAHPVARLAVGHADSGDTVLIVER